MGVWAGNRKYSYNRTIYEIRPGVREPLRAFSVENILQAFSAFETEDECAVVEENGNHSAPGRSKWHYALNAHAEAPSFLWSEEVPKVETFSQWASFTAPWMDPQFAGGVQALLVNNTFLETYCINTERAPLELPTKQSWPQQGPSILAKQEVPTFLTRLKQAPTIMHLLPGQWKNSAEQGSTDAFLLGTLRWYQCVVLAGLKLVVFETSLRLASNSDPHASASPAGIKGVGHNDQPSPLLSSVN